MARTNHIGHVLQRAQSPADGCPDQQRQAQAAKQKREQGMAYDAVDQVVTHIVALTHPDHPLLFGHR
ncbi:hypothetical protein D3C73_1119630 [compost metagenome]